MSSPRRYAYSYTTMPHELAAHSLFSCACAVPGLHLAVSAALETLMLSALTDPVCRWQELEREGGPRYAQPQHNRLPDRDSHAHLATRAEVSQRRFVLVAADHPSTLIPLRPTIAYAPNRMLTIRCSCSQLSRPCESSSMPPHPEPHPVCQRPSHDHRACARRRGRAARRTRTRFVPPRPESMHHMPSPRLSDILHPSFASWQLQMGEISMASPAFLISSPCFRAECTCC